MSADAYHVSSPSKSGDGAQRAMLSALQDAKIGPECIDYINAHATSTPMGDDIEAAALSQVFDLSKGPLVSSTKGATGHMLGAAGAMEAAIAAMSVRDNAVPPTLGLQDPSMEALNHVIGCESDENRKARGEIRYSLSNSFGFGGTNSCIIFKSVAS